MNEVISNPENAKHIADHRPMRVERVPVRQHRCGRKRRRGSEAGERERAAADQEAGRNPQADGCLRSAATCRFAGPTMLTPAAIQMPARTNVTEYQRDAPSHAHRSPPIAAMIAPRRRAGPTESRTGC